ncbi:MULTISPECIES: hypothetical protein [Bacillus cereus group]|uniref:beta barrel domain-containing protein n=1 Tax=Bacillus cereus group TaxID=86661 RepID=UPI00065C0376|nr:MULTISPECIES: hypothetical protein [Bacillus cereus group]MCM0006133.1 hypothetical protein [Bacillus paranthracis]MDX6046755.1 hypothetical protein [Bacillus paranthracis]
MTKPFVGQKVYLEPCNNQARRSSDIKELEIKKVGRKYLYVGDIGEQEEYLWLKFNRDNLRQVSSYSPNWHLHFSKQGILDKQEYTSIISELSELFRYANFYSHRTQVSLEQLRKIKDVLNS